MCIYVHAHMHVSVWLCVYLVMCVGVRVCDMMYSQ